MRREERHHLKDNALAAWVAQVRNTLRRRRRALVVAGWIAEAYNINLLFAVSLAFGIIGAALLWRWVREPRQASNEKGKF